MAKPTEEQSITQEEPTKALIIAPNLFDLIDEEELNPPSYTGSKFIGEVLTIKHWEWSDSDEYGKIVVAICDDQHGNANLAVAFTAWRTVHYFTKIQEYFIPCPFRVKIEADKRSYKFASAD